MNTRPSFIRIAAAVVAICALGWLVATVNRHGDDAQRGAALMLHQSPPRVVESDRSEGGGGLDLVDMYQCMCASSDDISLWVKWWFIATIFGAIPVALLIRGHRESSEWPRPYVSHPIA
jgi:hypothetical protein